MFDGMQVARDAEGILKSDPGVLGRHAPDMVVAKLEEGWIIIKRAAVRGQPRTVEVSEAHAQPPKDPAQLFDYVLITLPESVRYSKGVSGEIRIDVYGNIVEWAGARDSEGFQAKVERLREQIASAHKSAPLSQRVRAVEKLRLIVISTKVASCGCGCQCYLPYYTATDHAYDMVYGVRYTLHDAEYTYYYTVLVFIVSYPPYY